MTTGRKPTPTALKKLQGNPGGKSLNEREPELPVAKCTCPRHLKGHARKEWKRLVGDLVEYGVLSEGDLRTFEAYCEAYRQWRDAMDAIDKHGLVMTIEDTGYVQQRPEVGIANRALANMLKASAELGLTPSSRSRVVAVDSKRIKQKAVQDFLYGE